MILKSNFIIQNEGSFHFVFPTLENYGSFKVVGFFKSTVDDFVCVTGQIKMLSFKGGDEGLLSSLIAID